VQDRIFITQEAGLPEMVFGPEFQIRVTCGGCLFVPEEFLRLQECILSLGEDFFFLIENTFGGLLRARFSE
jgi:hypothetical protein